MISSDMNDVDFSMLLATCDQAIADGDEDKVEQLLKQNPELTERLCQNRQCIELLRQVWPKTERQDRNNLFATKHTGSSPPFPESFGHFHIVRPLGSGGSGLVFLARDLRLDRLVALKIPRPEFLITDELRQRFQQEARLAALLDHHNLVSVYEAGEIGPICYIASAYCPGMTLADWLRGQKQPITPGIAARFLIGLAEAIQHAHSRGVLHRDLKPSNVLLNFSQINSECHRADSSLDNPRQLDEYKAKIADFGLARLMDANDTRTNTGAILGTPNYMSPEQASGQKEMTTATDIYGLGTIFYELLTGRPPFRGNSDLETLQQIRTNEPVPPSRIRPKLPRDLGTICLKCLEKEPRNRYPSASALAEDLQRFLDAEPIQARPSSVSERAWKWARRRPAIASLLTIVIVVSLLGIGGMAWQWRRAEDQATVAKQQRDQAHRKSTEAEQQRAAAKANLQDAVEVVASLTGVAEQLVYEPGAERASLGALQEAVQFYERILPKNGDDRRIRKSAARAYLRVGWMQLQLGLHNEAEASCLQGISIFQGLLQEPPGDDCDRQKLAECETVLANILKEVGKYQQSEQLYQRALKRCQELTPRCNMTRLKILHGNTHLNLGDLLVRIDRLDEAEKCFERAIEFQKVALLIMDQKLASEKPTGRFQVLHKKPAPKRAAYCNELALALNGLADLQRYRRQYAEAESNCRQALNIHRQLAVDYPESTAYRFFLAGSYRTLAQIQFDTDQFSEAESSYQKAILRLEHLAASSPLRPYYRSTLISNYEELTKLFLATNRGHDARNLAENIFVIRAKMIHDFPKIKEQRQAGKYVAELLP